MTIFLENPLPAMVAGGLLTFLLCMGLIQTRRHTFLALAGASLLATIGMVLLERKVVTQWEQIEHTLKDICTDLETNAPENVLRYISSRADQLKRRANIRMRQGIIVEASVKPNLRIDLLSDHHPPLAQARFNGVLKVRGRLSKGVRIIPRFFVVDFRKEEDGMWRVTDFEASDPRDGL